MKQLHLLFIVLSVLLSGCKTQKPVTSPSDDDGIITFKFIQLNDVYEIAPLSGGKYGGMARVAHIKDSIKTENPNTFMFMAGDFLNPSLLGTIKYEGERIQGKQMIEVMNAMGFSAVTFGNHEFDIGEEALQKRLDESNFPWSTANVKHRSNGEIKHFTKENGHPVSGSIRLSMRDDDGTELEVSLLSVTIDSNPQDFVYYGANLIQEAEFMYNSLHLRDEKYHPDIVIGLTHLRVEQDRELARQIPELPFIMGGHEHNNMLLKEGNTIIAKADANAKTIYIHTLTYNKSTKELNIDSHLQPIDERIASQPQVKAIVDRWNTILDAKIKEVVDNPNEVIYQPETPLDGTDSANRGIQTNLGEIITHAMALSFNDKDIDGALVNGGSIRIDDMLAGDVTSLDIFRVLPFGGNVVKVTMKGSLLIQVLDYGKSKGGTGAYLQRYNFQESENGSWLIDHKPVDINTNYTVALSDFLLKGFDIPFLTPKNDGVVDVYEPNQKEPASDIRKAVIVYLKSLN